MTKISFYILNSNTPQQRQEFACRLAEKAYHQGLQVYIHTDDAEQSTACDKALWAIRPDSFVPHDIVIQNVDSNIAPVLIGSGDSKPPRLMDVLINLSQTKPDFFSQFERMAEIIDDNDHTKQAGRTRFQFYKERGYELSTHKI